MRKKNTLIIDSIVHDAESRSNLYVCNCVYKVTTHDGYYKIGHTTESVRDRLSKYIATSAKEEIAQHIKLSANIHIEILYRIDNPEMLMLFEQLSIMNEVGKILNSHGIIPYHPNRIVNSIFKTRHILNSKLCNRRFDGVELLNNFFNGEYKSFVDNVLHFKFDFECKTY